jgi:hypothetical protein
MYNTGTLSPSSSSSANSSINSDYKYQHDIYAHELVNQTNIYVLEQFSIIRERILRMRSECMIDEFLFWCTRFEFPEILVKFLLSLLPDANYKVEFIKSFVSQYSYISMLILNSRSESLPSKVVHISLQLFSNELITLKALNECYLLEIILSAVYNMIIKPTSKDGQLANLLVKSRLEQDTDTTTEEKNEEIGHMVVDADKTICIG